MKLYMTEMSGNSFKIRVLAAMLGVTYENIRIDWEHNEHKSPEFLQRNPLAMAEVMQWMSFAQNEVQFGLQWARGVTIYNRRPESFQGYLEDGRTALNVLEGHLGQSRDWLALGRATLADIACYPYVKRAPEGDLPLDDYPAIRAWLARCEALPGWIEMDP